MEIVKMSPTQLQAVKLELQRELDYKIGETHESIKETISSIKDLAKLVNENAKHIASMAVQIDQRPTDCEVIEITSKAIRNHKTDCGNDSSGVNKIEKPSSESGGRATAERLIGSIVFKFLLGGAGTGAGFAAAWKAIASILN